jgi:hypothetical protein
MKLPWKRKGESDDAWTGMGEDYPKGRDVGDEHRLSFFILRLLAVLLGLSFSGNIFQTAYNYWCIEKTQYLPLILKLEGNTDQVIAVRAASVTGDVGAMMAEGNAREYVRRRQQVLPDARAPIGGRLGYPAYYAAVAWLRARSSKEVFDQVTAERPRIEAAIEQHVTRSVEVVSASLRGTNYYQVDFRVTDMQNNQPIAGTGQTLYHAYLRYDWNRPVITREDVEKSDLANFFGWTVTMYAVQQEPPNRPAGAATGGAVE